MSKIKTVFGFDMETDVGSWASTYDCYLIFFFFFICYWELPIIF